MRSPEHIERIAIGDFSDPARLRQAINELVDGAVPRSQLCAAFDQKRTRLEAWEEPQSDSPAGELLEDVELVCVPEGGEQIVATTGHFLTLDFKRGMPREMIEQMRGHLRSGAVLLLVKALSQAQLAQAARILLRHSSHHVHSLELPAP